MTTEPTPSRALRFLLSLRQQDWLALMLLALHAALVFGIDTALSKAFLLSHFGCFLLWQPVLRGEQKLYVGQALLIVGRRGGRWSPRKAGGSWPYGSPCCSR